MIQRMDNLQQRAARRLAFTLMEMLVVVAIIVALAGIGGFFVMGALVDSQVDIAQTQVSSTLTNACKAYYMKRQQWPQQLTDLLVRDDLGGPYLESKDALLDPWGRPYQYDPAGTNNNGMKPDIFTTNPQTQVPIGNWPKNR